MLMATGQDYTISLPFKTLEHPDQTAYDEGPHDIELQFTLDAEMFDGEPDEDDVQNAVDQCFGEAQFLAPVVFYSGSGGYLSLLLPPNTTPDLRTFNFRYDRDRKGFSFSQGRLVAEEAILSVSSQRPLFPSSSDTREITMSGGTEGIGYTLCRDDEQLGTVTYQGASISFGHVNTPGTYRVSRPEGYTVGNEITLRLYDVFVLGAYRATDMQITEVPCDGGYASATVSLDRSISTYDLQELETWFNTRQEDISFWPQLGQRISLCAETDNTYTVDIICPPNLSSVSRTFDTGMYLTPDGQGTLKFIQQGGGTLEDFNVTGTALNAEETFDVSLSGSQLGVTYSLIHEGETVSTMTGTGLPLTFRGLTMSGVYSVVAEYCYHTRTMTDTYTAAVPGEPGGSNYIATHQYVGDGTSAVTDIMYYGGLGYPVQEVRTSFVEKGSDLVRGIIYDSMGRPDAKVMLPYTRRSINSHYDVSHISSQEAYYRNHGFGDGTNANKVNAYETGESGRLLSSRREGDIYSELDRKVTYGYRLNVAADEIRKFIYTPHTGSSPARVETDGTFPGSSLKVVCITDEDNRTTETFSDMSGDIILERKRNADEVCDTYYIYDIRDSLVCVIQPMGVREMGNGFDLDSEFAQKWCFTYRYDSVGNMTERHVPGCGTDVMAYDLRGRLVLSSNALQRQNSKYRYYLYDELDRITEEGYAGITSSIGSVRDSLMKGGDIRAFLSNASRLRQCDYYSDTSVPEGFMEEPGAVDGETVTGAGCVTLLKSETVLTDPAVTAASATADYRIRTYFYDCKGRTVQILEKDRSGWTSRFSFAYDFTGNVTTCVERHAFGARQDCMKYMYEYDDRGRKTLCIRELNGKTYAPVSYFYDELGRLTLVQCDGKVDELYSYNLQGWPQTQDVFLYGQPDAFHMTLRHYLPESTSAVPAYGGFVSEATSCHFGHEQRTTVYMYDELGRVMRAETDDGLAEDIRYDANGNILSLCRTGNDEEEKTVSYDYDGNQVIQTDDDGSVSRHTYYPNGSLLAKTGENLQFSYNFSNLLTAVRKNGISRPLAEVIHLADGIKTAAKLSDGSTLVYHGRFVYKVLANGRLILESVEHDHGRFVAGSENTGNTEFIDTWHVRDYLGSVRAVYDITPNYTEDLSDVILEQNDYYVFGGRINSQALPSWSSNRYRFNGKEQLATATADLGLTDYGARMYSSRLSRWTTPDPLADKYFSTSPYAFCGNNPVNYVDPNGKAIETLWDIASVVSGVKNLIGNVRDGNYKAAFGDGVGIAVDAAAILVPGVPGGVGAIRAGTKAANTACEILKLEDDLKSFKKAAEFGVDSYNNLRKNVLSKYGTGSNLEVHHLIEQRFAGLLGVKKGDMPSVVLTKDEHRKFTNAWKEEIGYKGSNAETTTTNATKEKVLDSAKNIYKDKPEILKLLE